VPVEGVVSLEVSDDGDAAEEDAKLGVPSGLGVVSVEVSPE